MKKSTYLAIGILGFVASALIGCSSDAQKASENASVAADNFEVLRRITVVNTWNGETLWDLTGRCSLEVRPTDLVVTCKEAPNEYKKHYISTGGNVAYTSTQLQAIDVDVYRTRIIFKPQNVVPNVDLSVGNQ
jgi:hypothetical protein